MEEFTKPKKPWYKKPWGIVLIVLIFLFIIGGIANSSDEKKPSTTSESKSEKKWTEIIKLSGSGEKKSETFQLTGGDAKILYKYDGDGELGAHLFMAYVIQEGEELMKDGGLPEVSCSTSETGETALHNSAGKYYVNILAQGSWEISVMEQR